MIPKAEPKRRKDGRCFVCPKKVTTNNPYGEADAFCSSTCCRAYFGTTVESKVSTS